MNAAIDFLWRGLAILALFLVARWLHDLRERWFEKSMTTKQKIDRLQAELNEMHTELVEKLEQLEALKGQLAAEAHAEAGRSGELH